jgi:hypothetical protein
MKSNNLKRCNFYDIINFDKTWSLINNFSEDFNIYVTDLVNNEKLNNIDCEVFFLTHLQRIQ